MLFAFLVIGSGGMIKLVRTFGSKDKKKRKGRSDKGKYRPIYNGREVKIHGSFLLYFRENYGKNIEFTEKFKKSARELKKKRYWENHKEAREKVAKYYNKRRKIDIDWRVKEILRVNFREALRRYIKTGKIMSSIKYGIDYKIIIKHLKPFPKNILNYHIDHIRPLRSFNFVNPDGSTNLEEVKKAFAPKNLQWLTAKENMRKSGRWDGTN